MNIDKIKDVINTLQAVLDGKQIQYQPYIRHPIGIHPDVWMDMDDPLMGLLYDIRIKPGPEYVPFDITDDLIGKTIIWETISGDINKFSIVAQITGSILIGSEWYTYQEAFEKPTFTIDGHKFGKLKED